MKTGLFLATLVMLGSAQRPSFAGPDPIGLPGLANRFKDDPDISTTAINLGNRVGDGTTQRLPIDAKGDAHLVDRLNKYPNENKPFWLLNAQHIERHRNTTQQFAGGAQPNVIQQQTNSNLDNRFGNTDNFESEIDDFGNPIKKQPTSLQPSKIQFAGSLP